MRPLLAWFAAHRKTSAALVTILVLWAAYQALSWQTEREWRNYCAEARARGVKLTFAELETPSIPDEENFGALPMFKVAFAAPPGAAPNPFKLPPAPSGQAAVKRKPLERESEDWAGWQKAFLDAKLIDYKSDNPIADVLRGIDQFAPQIGEWQQWRQRPQFRSPIVSESATVPRSPHHGLVQSACFFFDMRMRAHFACRDGTGARADFEDLCQANRILRKEPGLVGGLMHIGMLAFTLKDMAAGLEQQVWAETDLSALEAQLRSMRIPEDFAFAFSSERMASNATCEHLLSLNTRQRAETFSQFRFGPSDHPVLSHISEALPQIFLSSRKVRKNQLRLNRFFDEVSDRFGKSGGIAAFVRNSRAGEKEPNAFEFWQYPIFHLLRPIYVSTAANYTAVENRLNQTRIAIALERFRLGRGMFPATLDELLSELLPELPFDPWTHAAMKYRRTDTGSFLLYSAGKDGEDDNGVIDPEKREGEQRDAVWLHAPH